MTASKTFRRLALATAFGITGLATAVTLAALPAMAQQDDDGPAGEVDLETFYRELAPHGRWFEHPRYGTVWSPSVDEGWKPYSRGHWANTEEHGWYWVAEEEWGWAPFHYGRWAHGEDDGWFWVPGTTWAPAWVTWRSNDDFVGWAPLPPDADWEPDGNLRFYSSNYDNPRWAFAWSFVQPRYMFEPGLHWRLASRSRAIAIIRDTRPVHRYSFVNRRIYNHGIDYRRIERLAERPIPTVRLRFSNQVRDNGWRGMNDRTVLPVYKPRIVSRAESTPPPFRSRDGGTFGGRPNWSGGDRRDQPRVQGPPGGSTERPSFGGSRGSDPRLGFEVQRRPEPAQAATPPTPMPSRGFNGRNDDARSPRNLPPVALPAPSKPAATPPAAASQPAARSLDGRGAGQGSGGRGDRGDRKRDDGSPDRPPRQ